jgi:hypothetical protein
MLGAAGAPAETVDTVRDPCWQCPDPGLESTTCGVRERRPQRLAEDRKSLLWASGHVLAERLSWCHTEMPHTLIAALHREEDWFIAQCLEVDVASQGHTIDGALAGLAVAVGLYLEEG